MHSYKVRNVQEICKLEICKLQNKLPVKNAKISNKNVFIYENKAYT